MASFNARYCAGASRWLPRRLPVFHDIDLVSHVPQFRAHDQGENLDTFLIVTLRLVAFPYKSLQLEVENNVTALKLPLAPSAWVTPYRITRTRASFASG
jgi:hypothetical protein